MVKAMRNTSIFTIAFFSTLTLAFAWSASFPVPAGASTVVVTQNYSNGQPATSNQFSVPSGATSISVDFGSSTYPTASASFFDGLGSYDGGETVSNPSGVPTMPYDPIPVRRSL